MKKLLTSLLAVALIACATVAPANAAGTITADEQKIITKLEGYGVPAEYVTQAKNYLLANDVTSADVNTLISKIEEVKAMCDEAGITTVKQLEDADASFHNKFLAAVNNAAAVIGVKVSVSADGTVTAVDSKGNPVTGSTTKPMGQTGASVDTAIATLAGLVAVVAVSGAVASKKKLFA